MVRRKFKLLSKTKRVKVKIIKVKLPRKRILTTKQISKSLTSRKEKTLQKIILSKGASPSSKERARRLLNG